MRLAVIIPCYNHARYVGAAVESALSQSRPPERVIVIDDGSSDHSVEVLRGFEGRGVSVSTQPNAGAHNTLNTLVANAGREGCDLVAILNSDDLYLPGRFERCLPEFEKDGNLAVLTTGLELMDDDGGELDPESSRAKWFRAAWSLRGREFPEWMGVCNFPATTSNVIARTDYLLANPFRPYRFNHDYFLLAKSVIEGRFGLVDEPLVRYRVHANNTITTDPAPLVREMLRMAIDLAADLAGPMRADAGLLERYGRFRRATWDSISSFDPALAELAFAQLAAAAGEERRSALAAEAPAGDTFPNRHLVNTHDGTSPVVGGAAGGALSAAIDRLRAERDAARSALAAAKGLAKRRAAVAGTRKYALGRLFGRYGELMRDRGKTPEEKLANFEEAARRAGFDA